MMFLSRSDRMRREAIAFSRYSIHMSIVLSVIVSLAVVVIISKRQPANSVWLDAAVVVVPMVIALYFKNRIALLGAFAHVAVLVFVLAAAVMFGV